LSPIANILRLLQDSDEALTFEATITPQIADMSYGADVLALLSSGMAVGLSPGFRIPQKRAVPEAEKVEDEGMDPARGMHNAIISTILQALLYELSIVTRPAYQDATVEHDDLGQPIDDKADEQIAARNWQIDESGSLRVKTIN
jgi:phage head maturation protease